MINQDNEYPTVVTPDQDPDGTVLVVTDYTFAKYLGRLDIVFDDLGRVTEWSGNPILLNKEVEEDPEVLAEINEWGEAVRNLTKERIGSTHVYLDGARESCRLKECNLGNMIADAYIWVMVTFPDEEKWNDVSIAIQNSGGIRSSITQVVTPDQDPDGTVLVVTDYTFAKYLGRLDIVFDDLGRVTEWSGNPILLNKEVEEDPEVLAEINEWGEAVRNLTKERIGSTHVYLDGARESCRLKECNLGNMIADAYIWVMVTFPDEEKWNDVSIVIQNSGGIRSSITQGDVTFGDVTTVLPFGSTVDTVELEGRYVKEMLENSVAEYSPVDLPGRFLQMSGMWVTYDISREPNDRVVDVQVRCTECNIPEYLPLEENKLYKMVMPSFIADGGDGYDMIAEHGQNRYSGNLDTNVISDYIEKFSPIYSGIERRITFATDRATSIVPKSSIFGILLVASRLVFPLLWS
ncbi:snake venom 5'-nucleotidase-like [Amphiura filiformis]|uniref:snake venom 5'-nucleotidase-like n=1 Tax=Amphiura filiformis TaxID=82378 RepID=UPI003B216C9C